ncbi:MAG: hypothetical protein ACR2NB_05755 [Solirubrobacteraceae bacterium]
MTVSDPARERAPSSLLDRNLALWPGYQMGKKALAEHVERRDFLGMVARADRAPLGETELDVLTWITARWWGAGRDPSGVVSFTRYAARRALYGEKSANTNNRRVSEALDNLLAVLITVNGVNVRTGEKARYSKVHLLESYVVADQISMFGDAEEYDACAVGGLRGATVEVQLAGWLVNQLLSAGGIGLDWSTQRRLSGYGKRLWIHLASSGVEWHADDAALHEHCSIALTRDLYEGLGISCGRPRDDRAAIVRASKTVLADDPAYVAAIVEPPAAGCNDWVLHITRSFGAVDDVDPVALAS